MEGLDAPATGQEAPAASVRPKPRPAVGPLPEPGATSRPTLPQPETLVNGAEDARAAGATGHGKGRHPPSRQTSRDEALRATRDGWGPASAGPPLGP